MTSPQSQKLFDAIYAVDPIENTEIKDPLKIFEKALAEGADVNAKNDYGNTPLTNIINLLPIAGNSDEIYYKMIDLLLRDERLDPNIRNNDEKSALDLAAVYFLDKAVKKLLDCERISVCTKDRAMQEIEKMQHEQASVIEKQITESIDKNPLISAIKSGYLQKVKELLNGLDKKQNDVIEYALMQAAKKGYKDTIEELIKAGAVMDLQSKNGKTAEDIANENGHKEIAKILGRQRVFAVLNGPNVTLQQGCEERENATCCTIL